jgi:hypothetical protein
MESQMSGGSTYRLGQNSREIGVRASFQQPAVNYLDRHTTYDPRYRWQNTNSLYIVPTVTQRSDGDWNLIMPIELSTGST